MRTGFVGIQLVELAVRVFIGQLDQVLRGHTDGRCRKGVLLATLLVLNGLGNIISSDRLKGEAVDRGACNVTRGLTLLLADGCLKIRQGDLVGSSESSERGLGRFLG